ncbi:hypothetical protein D3OALGA1CA_2213 [Olavius algarvensis associated proteobacterium Delta 3]|nr:hypothetical protein D3OALGA1CA_2213 [Olavius algarvensis associated proteobacterium Delta 3]
MKPTLIDAAVSKRCLLVTFIAALASVTVLLTTAQTDAAPGDLDTGFGTNGRFTTAIVAGGGAAGQWVALQEDGKIVVAGISGEANFSTPVRFSVTRLDADGTPDTTFAGCDPSSDPLCAPVTADGTTAFSFASGVEARAYAVAIQSDGKIVVVGSSGVPGSGVVEYAVARLTTTGALDPDFNGDGDDDGRVRFNINTGTEEQGQNVAIQPDGKIVVVGNAGAGSSGLVGFGIARLNSDGSFDLGFGTNGVARGSLSSGEDTAYDLAFQSDGKIIVAGTSNETGIGLSEFGVVRLESDGDLDATFGTGGVSTVSISSGTSDAARTVAIQGDGKIVAAGIAGRGSSNADFGLARWNTSGNLDPTFGSGGKLRLPFSNVEDGAEGVAIQPDGKIVVAGFRAKGTVNAEFALARLDTDGSLDTSFGSDGRVDTAFSNLNDAAFGVVLQPDGKIVAAGLKAEGNLNGEFAVARYLGDTGGLDTSFGSDGTGTVTTDINGGDDEGSGLALQSNGDIVVAGLSETTPTSNIFHFPVATYDRNGILRFEVSSPNLSNNDRGQAVAVQSDGKILVAGITGEGSGNSDFMLARYNANGSADTTFGGGDGMVATDFDTRDDRAYAVAIQEDGKIVVAGNALDNTSGQTEIAVARYLVDGTLDPDFDTDGRVMTFVPGSSGDGAFAVVIQPDGAIVVAGESDDGSDRNFALVRYLTGGAPDPAFGTIGIVTSDFDSMDDQALGLVLQDNEKIIVVGKAELSAAGSSAFAIAQFNSDGSPDNTFGTWVNNGQTALQFSQRDDRATSVALQTTGNIIVAGVANEGGGESEFGIARLDRDGALDTSFGVNGLLRTGITLNNDGALAVAVRPDNNVIAAGLANGGSPSNFALAQYGSFITGVAPPAGGDDDSGGGCFIATAAYGSPMDSHVQVLRDFRDRFLLPHSIGHGIVRYYCRYSPPVADAIATQDTVKHLVRAALVPLVGLSWLAVTLGSGGFRLLMLVGLIGVSARFLRQRNPIRPGIE